MHLEVNAILSVSDDSNVTQDSATLICKLPCFTSNLQCSLHNISANGINLTVKNETENIIHSLTSYNYPTQSIILMGLNMSTTYNYCVVAQNTNKSMIGKVNCGVFTTGRGGK